MILFDIIIYISIGYGILSVIIAWYYTHELITSNYEEYGGDVLLQIYMFVLLLGYWPQAAYRDYLATKNRDKNDD